MIVGKVYPGRRVGRGGEPFEFLFVVRRGAVIDTITGPDRETVEAQRQRLLDLGARPQGAGADYGTSTVDGAAGHAARFGGAEDFYVHVANGRVNADDVPAPADL